MNLLRKTKKLTTGTKLKKTLTTVAVYTGL